jgi:hypothetical protein
MCVCVCVCIYIYMCVCVCVCTVWTHKLIITIGNEEELPDQCGRSLRLYQLIKSVIKLTNNFHGISLLSTSYKILSNILYPNIDEIIWLH